MAITRKDYICLTCGRDYATDTNHEGKIYPWCPRCNKQTTHALKTDPEKQLKDAAEHRAWGKSREKLFKRTKLRGGGAIPHRLAEVSFGSQFLGDNQDAYFTVLGYLWLSDSQGRKMRSDCEEQLTDADILHLWPDLEPVVKAARLGGMLYVSGKAGHDGNAWYFAQGKNKPYNKPEDKNVEWLASFCGVPVEEAEKVVGHVESGRWDNAAFERQFMAAVRHNWKDCAEKAWAFLQNLKE